MKKMNGMKKLVTLCFALALTLSLVVSAGAASKGYTFKSKGATITPGINAASFLSKNGKGTEKKSASCAYNGYDYTHSYTGFVVKTYTKSKTDTKQYVNSIELTSSKVKTPEGIKIGSSQKDVVKKYGKAKNNFGVYTYVKGSTKMTIEFDSINPNAKSKVKSIKIMKK